MRLLFSILCLLTTEAFAQREILKTNLSEFGSKFTYKEVWTNDKYIIVLAEGIFDKKNGNIFLVIDPDQGVVASHIVPRQAVHPYSTIMDISDETITIFYRLLENGNRQNYRLTFSVDTKGITVEPIGDEIEKIEKESFFSFMDEERLLFASVTKDKQKIGFRQMTRQGTALVTHVFDLPDSLWDFLNPKKSSFSRKKIYRSGNLYRDHVRLLGSVGGAKDFTGYIFDFDLNTQKIKINKFSQDNGKKYKTLSMSLAGDKIFLLKLSFSSPSERPAYQMDLEILGYPAFQQEKFFTSSLTNLRIPYKTSRMGKISFKTGLYFSGRNRKFTDLPEENVSTIKLMSTLSRGIPFIETRLDDPTQTTHLTIGSNEELLVTNSVINNIYYFFGCLDSQLNPCTGTEKTSSEKIVDYLEQVREEKPDYTEFGRKRHFAIFNLYQKKEIALLEF